jgi:hypothetical protein
VHSNSIFLQTDLILLMLASAFFGERAKALRRVARRFVAKPCFELYNYRLFAVIIASGGIKYLHAGGKDKFLLPHSLLLLYL